MPTVEVTLRQPPPLDTAHARVTGTARRALTVLSFGGAPVAEARAVDAELTTSRRWTPDVAADAMAPLPRPALPPVPRLLRLRSRARAEGDGLQIFPGPVPGRADTVASLWVPHASLAESGDVLDGVERVGVGTTWASLDCVGGWSEDLQGRPMVLGRMTARVDALPVVGEPHVVVGQRRRVDGRKTFTASTLYDSDHRVVATPSTCGSPSTPPPSTDSVSGGLAPPGSG